MNPYQLPTEELEKCKNDIVYFVEKYVKIKTTKGISPIKLRDFQKDILRKFEKERFNIVLPARQTYHSTNINLFLTKYIKFNTNKTIVLLEMKTERSIYILEHLKFMLESVGVKCGISTNTLLVENNCKVMIMKPKEYLQIIDAELIIWDQMAYYGNLRELWSKVYPKVIESNKTQVILSSSPNGKNYFKELWDGAVNGETVFKPLRVDYWEVPGRDAKWVENMKENMKEEGFNEQFGLSFEE